MAKLGVGPLSCRQLLALEVSVEDFVYGGVESQQERRKCRTVAPGSSGERAREDLHSWPQSREPVFSDSRPDRTTAEDGKTECDASNRCREPWRHSSKEDGLLWAGVKLRSDPWRKKRVSPSSRAHIEERKIRATKTQRRVFPFPIPFPFIAADLAIGVVSNSDFGNLCQILELRRRIMSNRGKSLTLGDLPLEILLEILWRLPVKSLTRFASVSKSWKSLITSRPFIVAHLKRAIGRRDPPSLLLLRQYSLTHKEERNTLYIDGESLVEQEQLRFPTGPSESFYYVGSCNGLLCFADYVVNHLKIVLWNPSIRKLLRLPIPGEESTGSIHTYVVGFGFDEKCDEYKFLRLVYTWSKNWSRTFPKEVEIYELRTNAWRSVDVDVPYVIPESSAQVLLDGSLHWIGLRMSDDGVLGARPLLLVFDLHDETFREMEIPVDVLFANAPNLSITIYQDSLCLFQCHPWMPDGHQLHGICWVWVMKEYGVAESWTKLFAIDICELGGIVRVIGFRRHGEVLLVTPNDELVSYNPESQKISRLGLYGVANSFEVVNYVESLTLLERDNCVGPDSDRASASRASFR